MKYIISIVYATAMVAFTMILVAIISFRASLTIEIEEHDQNKIEQVNHEELNVIVEEPIAEKEPVKLVTKFPIYSITNDFIKYENDKKEEPVVETPLTDEEIDLLARLTAAEAGGEPEEGKRLVIDTVLNRVDHWAFPDNVEDVICQPYHFSPVWNGGINCYDAQEEIVELIKEEMIERTNYEVIYFQAKSYSIYGTPLFEVGNHYFSSY